MEILSRQLGLGRPGGRHQGVERRHDHRRAREESSVEIGHAQEPLELFLRAGKRHLQHGFYLLGKRSTTIRCYLMAEELHFRGAEDTLGAVDREAGVT